MKGRRVISSVILCIMLTLMIIKVIIVPLPNNLQQFTEDTNFSIRSSTNPNSFLSIWDTTKTTTSSSNNNQIHLPLQLGGTYSFEANWGDGTNDTITSWDQASTTHTYTVPGVYTLNITGKIQGWRFNNGGDRLKILEIEQWGSLQLINSGSYFYGCLNLNLTATDSLNLSGITNFHQFFRDCGNLGSSGTMNGWDVSSATDMSEMFYNSYSFNQPIGNWIVSNVSNMNNMFFGASSFNQPLDTWDVSKVNSIIAMFYKAISFNQPLGSWDVSHLTDMSYMFYEAKAFNQPLGSWDVSNVARMILMFYGIKLSTANYDDLLIGWSQQSLQHGVEFHAGNSQCSLAGIFARETLISTFEWTIIDKGEELANKQAFIIEISFGGLMLVLIFYLFCRKYKKRI